MSFSYRGNNQSQDSGNNQNVPKVNWEELNKYVVETAQLEQRETLTGIISMIVDLGLQPQEDSKVVFTGTKEEEAEIISKFPSTYFEDGYDFNTKANARMRCWTNKATQCVAVAVDFPDIVIDKGKFFGESKPLPLRLWLGGVKFDSESRKMLIQRPSVLRVVNLDKTRNTKKWSLSSNSTLYNMAVGSKLITAGEVFLPNRIDELLGKPLQFEVQVSFNDGKDGKRYYNEYIKYKSALARGQVAPSLPYEPKLVTFDSTNSVETIKEIREHVLNTIKLATDYSGSEIEKSILNYESVKSENNVNRVDDKFEQNSQASTVVKTENVQKTKQVEIDNDDFYDDDVPF